MGAPVHTMLAGDKREVLIRALVNDRLDLLRTRKSLLEQAVKEGLRGFTGYSDDELIAAAVEANLGITLADIGFDEAGYPLVSDWLEKVKPGDLVYWTDPSERFAIANTKSFHDLSDEFWDSLTGVQQHELIQEAGESLEHSSGIYRLILVVTESGKVESGNSMVIIENTTRSVAEVLAHELTAVPS